jgi:hypothetical protein
VGRSQFEDALLMHKPIILGWLSDYNTQLSLGRHELGGGMHYGQLSDLQGPQFLKLDGSRALTGNLAVSAGVTIDGVDIGAHAADVNAHHVAASIQDSTTIDFTITGQTISGSVIQSALDHGSIGGLGDDDHTQYFNATRHTLLVHTNLGLTPNTRQVISGDGLSGGGDLSADRTLAVGAGTGISVAADSVAINLAANLTWTGNHVFQGGLSTRDVIPELTDTYDLGSSTKLWRKGWLSELESVLFAQNTITLLGGWFVVGKGEGSLPADVGSADTSIDFGQSMTTGQFVVIRTSLQVEYVQIGTLVSGTTYNVTRNLDGSGANDWPAGTVYLVLGVSGDGRIELNAADTPRISVLEQGSTYNAQNEQIRIGDLNGNWGYSSEKLGMAIGEYASNKANLTLDPTNGLRLRIHDTDYIVLDNSGNAKLSGKLQLDGTSSALAIGSTPPTANDAGTGLWLDRTGLYAIDADEQQLILDASGLQFGNVGGAFKSLLDWRGINLTAVDITYDPDNPPDETGSNINWRNPLYALYPIEYPIQIKGMVIDHNDGEGLISQISLLAKGDAGSSISLASVLDAGLHYFPFAGSLNLTPNEVSLVKVERGISEGKYSGLTIRNDSSILIGGTYVQIDGISSWHQIHTSMFVAGNVFSYLSPTSIIAYSYEIAHLFPVGTKIKFQQSGQKYFYVLSAVESGGNTTLTVTGGSDYTVANAEITEFYYSHGLAYGFPEWFNYSATWTAATTNPAFGNATRASRFSLNGRMCITEIMFTFGSTTTYGSGNWRIGLPILPTAVSNLQAFGNMHGRDAGVNNYERFAMINYVDNVQYIQYFNQLDQPNNSSVINSTTPFTWGSGDSISISISYLI